MSNYKKVLKHMLSNKNDLETVLYNEFMNKKYTCYRFHEIGHVTEKTALKIIKDLDLIALPSYKLRRGLPIGTIYVFKHNISRY